MSSYDNVVTGKLKLKGKALDVKAGGVKKKKKHKKRNDQITKLVNDDVEADHPGAENVVQLATAARNPEAGSRPLMNMNDTLNHGLPSQNRSFDHPGADNVVQGVVLLTDEKALSGLQARMERLKSGTMEHL